MSKREQYLIISNKIEAIENQTKGLHEKSYQLREEQRELICDIIRDEKLLEGTAWLLNISPGKTLSLKYDGSRSDSVIKDLDKMILGGWHSSFMLEPDIELRFDDSEVSLQFKDSKLVPLFAQKNKFIIIANNITDKLHGLKRQVAALETICHQFNLA